MYIGILSMESEHTLKMEARLDRVETRMVQIKEEVKRISAIEGSIKELRSEVKIIFQSLAQRLNDLLLHPREIASLSCTKASLPYLRLFEEFLRVEKLFLNHRGIESTSTTNKQISISCRMQAPDPLESAMPKKLQVSGDPDLTPISLMQHLFHFSPTKIILHLIESNVEEVSTWPNLVSSKPIPVDLHFVVINLPVTSIKTTRSTRSGSTWIGSSFVVTKELARVMVRSIVVDPPSWPPLFSSTPRSDSQ
ncbi:hypothetical protein Sjap_021818 [Stephania japonica]|uniref:Uncharacterized protein n=1 Tax=Stephania japonica TaxID=461633 RepID=A0AAP0EMN4_9MAGN